MMVPTEEHEEINPICPHCKKEILRVFFRELATILGKRYILLSGLPCSTWCFTS